MVEVVFKCEDQESFDYVVSLIEDEVDLESDIEEEEGYIGKLYIEENYSGSIGFLEEAISLAHVLVDSSPDTEFAISGCTITDHANMDFIVEYDGKICTSRDTGWYWYSDVSDHEIDRDEEDEDGLEDWNDYGDRHKKNAGREDDQSDFEENLSDDELYYDESSHKYSSDAPEMGKPEIIYWSDSPDENLCTFCRKPIDGKTALRKRFRAPGAPICRMCDDCGKKFDFSNWETVKETK